MTEPVIIATCQGCERNGYHEWQKTGHGEERVRQVLDACRDHEEATGHEVLWVVEYDGTGTREDAALELVSSCCGKPVTVCGRTTRHWECSACRQACDAVHPEHLKQSDREPPALLWPGWLPRDGSSGVPHFRPGSDEQCRYSALAECSCGGRDDDPERVRRAFDLLEVAHRTIQRQGGTGD